MKHPAHAPKAPTPRRDRTRHHAARKRALAFYAARMMKTARA